MQWLKDNGAPGFRGSRVYCEEVVKHVLDNDLEGKQDELDELDGLKANILREKLRGARFDNELKEGKYIPRETIGPRIYDLAADIKSTLQRELENELPLRIEGRAASEIRPEMRRVVDKICALFARGTRDLAS